jgi:hypothetical protein
MPSSAYAPKIGGFKMPDFLTADSGKPQISQEEDNLRLYRICGKELSGQECPGY